MNWQTSPGHLVPRLGRAHRLSFAGHVAIEYMVGAALAAAAVVLGFSQNTLLAACALGDPAREQCSWHPDFQRPDLPPQVVGSSLGLSLFAVTLASAIAGTGIATLVFAAATVIEAILLAITHYVPER